MVFNLLTNVIIWVYDTLKSVRGKPDYTIIDTSMEYYTNEIIPDEDTLDDFWIEEYDEWDGSMMSHYKSLNDIDYRNTKIPENIEKVVIRIKYWYRDKMYKYLTYDMNHEWPPEKTSGIVFNMPLSSAHLLDSHDKPVKDLLNKIRRYAGPRSDFHNQKVMVKDMLYYDDETLKEDYPTIRLKNIIGFVKNVDTASSYITDFRIP
tara:strand:+ start:3268 stop:3882 length:615 start_codon:yes stop_codon:yes gene_type:complete